jgi:ankyrin repeat protein
LNKNGLSVMHVAAQTDSVALMYLLYSRSNVSTNIKDNLGTTPLHWACYNGSENALSFILARNVDIN